MSNGIAVRQNEEKAIAMLAAQRQLYNDVKKIGVVSVTLSVWLPFAMALVLLFLSEESKWNGVSYLLAIGGMLASFVADKYIDEKKKLAAFIQQKFDAYVYNMSWDERIFGKDKNVNQEIVVYSKKILENDDDKDRLNNWYTPEVDNRDLAKGILLCQRENYRWDVGLRKRYRLVCIIMIIVLCSFVVTMGLWKNESFVMLLWRFAFIVPMIKWLLGTIKALNKDVERLKEMDAILNLDEPKTLDELQNIQKLIFEHRKVCYAIPDFFYKMFKDNDEDTAHRVVSMEDCI